jgi:hypothetical protein
MSAKNVRKPSRSIRYLLSGDRRLQKLSLRRMSALAKNGQKAARPRPSGPAQRVRDLLRFPWTLQSRAIALATIFVMAVVAMMAARPASNPSAVAARADSGRVNPSAANAPDVDPRANVAGGTPTSTSGVSASAPVTITGCLAFDHDTFLLKDTSGADAPKSRSWKTGFLKKRSPSIELVDAAKSLKLAGQVGRRVSATGVLTNGEMRVRSVQRVAASCS